MLPSRAHTVAVLSAIRRPRRKRKVGRIPRPLPPTRIAEAYAKAIRDRVCALARACFDEHAGEILHLLAERRRSMGRTDAANGIGKGVGRAAQLGAKAAESDEQQARTIAAALSAAERAGRKQYERERRSTSAALTGATIEGRYAGRLLDRAAREFAEKFHPTALHAVVKQFGRRTDEHSRQQLDQQLRSAIGVPLSTIEKPARDKIDGWAAANVDRIVTVPETYFDRLRLDVEEAFEDGTRPEDLADSFVERYGMSERQAELIARDQTLKLAADLNHDRMQSLGVERAIWRSMSDEKVCELCEAMEGVEFDLATGAGGPCGPGTLPGSCHPADRCWSEPDLSDLIPDVDDS